MKPTQFPNEMRTKMDRIAKRSRQDPECEFDWMIQHFSVENLSACFHSLDGKKAIGIDNVSKEEYGKELESNLASLVHRMKDLKYIPQPNRVTYIPKSDGGKRKLSIAAVEDKIVQTMFAKVLEAIYEPTFKPYSFGFRPNVGCHDALSRVNSFLFRQPKPAVYEIDFADFFGSIDHKKLIAILELRIKDRTFLRYVTRMLRSGEWRDGNMVTNKKGLPQGNIASPVLANIYAHYAIDRWFDSATAGNKIFDCDMVRYCDDAVFLFKNKHEALRFERLLKERIERFSLELNESKSHLLSLNKAAYARGAKQPTFSFLGFTFFLGRSKKGFVIAKIKTDAKGMRKKLKEIKSWLSWARNHLSMMQTWNKLKPILIGYTNYFGISHNTQMVQKFRHRVISMFFKFLNRRSQRRSITWENFNNFLKQYPLPDLPVKRLFF